MEQSKQKIVGFEKMPIHVVDGKTITLNTIKVGAGLIVLEPIRVYNPNKVDINKSIQIYSDKYIKVPDSLDIIYKVLMIGNDISVVKKGDFIELKSKNEPIELINNKDAFLKRSFDNYTPNIYTIEYVHELLSIVDVIKADSTNEKWEMGKL